VNEALDFVKDNGCDVLITEIEMDGIGGLILARNVQKQNPKVNIIFLTVCDAKEHAREVFNIRPSGYLLKPATKEQLEYELNHLRYSTCAI
jgi:two-component system response regulator YesN